jgi:hypothetical protein
MMERAGSHPAGRERAASLLSRRRTHLRRALAWSSMRRRRENRDEDSGVLQATGPSQPPARESEASWGHPLSIAVEVRSGFKVVRS